MKDLRTYIELIDPEYSSSLLYEGTINHEKISELLKKIRSFKMSNLKLSKSLYAVSNELLENARLHSSTYNNESNIKFGIFEKSDSMRVVCVNIANEEDLFRLNQKSEDLNEASTDQLKSALKERLMNGEVSKKGTIGAGMNIIKLKAKNRILISTEKCNSNRVRVWIDANIDKF